MEPTQERVLCACNEVLKVLGGGHREKIYENALFVELQNEFSITSQQHFPIMYKNHCVGHIVADLILNNNFVVEIKAQTTKIGKKEQLQLMKYVEVGQLKGGLIVNFWQVRDNNLVSFEICNPQ